MQKIKLNAFSQIEDLFRLLNLPGSDQELEEAREELYAVIQDKKNQLKKANYELAAEARALEIASINKIVELLNNKKILNHNILEIEVVLNEE